MQTIIEKILECQLEIVVDLNKIVVKLRDFVKSIIKNYYRLK